MFYKIQIFNKHIQVTIKSNYFGLKQGEIIMNIKNNKLGMSILTSHPDKKSISEQIEIYAKTGFDSFFLSCGVTNQFEKIPEWSSIAKRNNIEFEAVHNPNDNVDSIWQEKILDNQYENSTKRIIDFCSEGEVSKLVLHVGTSPLIRVSECGLEFWYKLEQYAKSKGIKLCYENSNVPELFSAVVKNSDSYHGICHDVGHQFCYTPDKNYEKIYADKFLYTHLHDNAGVGRDQHLIPGDGKINWETYFSQLKNSNYKGTLNLELSCFHSDEYKKMKFKNFTKIAYEKIEKLSDSFFN